MVLAPEHALAKELATDETREAVEQYIYDASMKSNVDRMQDKEKTGVFKMCIRDSYHTVEKTDKFIHCQNIRIVFHADCTYTEV